MKLVLIPAGKFRMGSPPGEKRRDKNEGPQHEVRITRSFYMGVYEVTQEEYQAVMGVNPSFFSAMGRGKDQVAGMDTRRFPVEAISWANTMEFCKKLSELPPEKKAGRVYRLPTEAEWEYACRAGTTTAYHFGDILPPNQANCNSDQRKTNKPVKVGSYAPNAWGLYDMHGNVWEFCLDNPRDYTADAVSDPKGSEAGLVRVLRGGSFVMDAGGCRATIRKYRADGAAGAYATPHSGFRVVCER